MEPSNLNHPSPEDEPAFEAQLKAHFSAPPLDDKGFSERVLAALPAPKRNARQFSRRHFLAGGLAAGVTIAAAGLVTSNNVDSGLTALDQTLTFAIGQLCTAPMAFALGFALLSVYYAFRGQWRLLPRL